MKIYEPKMVGLVEFMNNRGYDAQYWIVPDDFNEESTSPISYIAVFHKREDAEKYILANSVVLDVMAGLQDRIDWLDNDIVSERRTQKSLQNLLNQLKRILP
jgi:hypothetical protein